MKNVISYHLKVSIDTNLINAKQKLVDMNKIEQWRDEGKLEIVACYRFKMEVDAYNLDKAKKKEQSIPNTQEPFVVGMSYVGEAYISEDKTD